MINDGEQMGIVCLVCLRGITKGGQEERAIFLMNRYEYTEYFTSIPCQFTSGIQYLLYMPYISQALSPDLRGCRQPTVLS